MAIFIGMSGHMIENGPAGGVSLARMLIKPIKQHGRHRRHSAICLSRDGEGKADNHRWIIVHR
ncbi:hypothetical protein ASF29_23190 [Rhizobium sp. Leaf262]|nr:hypothetical protein ASF29_23190 [Rhizobium sp. Leaf262]